MVESSPSSWARQAFTDELEKLSGSTSGAAKLVDLYNIPSGLPSPVPAISDIMLMPPTAAGMVMLRSCSTPMPAHQADIGVAYKRILIDVGAVEILAF